MGGEFSHFYLFIIIWVNNYEYQNLQFVYVVGHMDSFFLQQNDAHCDVKIRFQITYLELYK